MGQMRAVAPGKRKAANGRVGRWPTGSRSAEMAWDRQHMSRFEFNVALWSWCLRTLRHRSSFNGRIIDRSVIMC